MAWSVWPFEREIDSKWSSYIVVKSFYINFVYNIDIAYIYINIAV